MKYCLYACFSQAELLKYPQLDPYDFFLIQWALEFFHRTSSVKKIIDGEVYCWMSYSLMVRDNPALKIDAQAVQKRMKKYESLGLLKHVCETDEYGRRSFFAIGPKMDSLQYTPSKDSDLWGVKRNSNDAYRDMDGLNQNSNDVYDGTHQLINKKNNKTKTKETIEETTYGSKEEAKPSSLAPKKKKSLEERKQEFHDEVFSHTEYPTEMLQAFYNHFSEADRAKNPKMLCEKEKTWETDLRLANWYARDKAKYNNAPKRDPRKVYDDDEIFYTDKI